MQQDASMTDPREPRATTAADAAAAQKEIWVKPVIEDFSSQIEGGSIGGASDVSVFHS